MIGKLHFVISERERHQHGLFTHQGQLGSTGQTGPQGISNYPSAQLHATTSLGNAWKPYLSVFPENAVLAHGDDTIPSCAWQMSDELQFSMNLVHPHMLLENIRVIIAPSRFVFEISPHDDLEGNRIAWLTAFKDQRNSTGFFDFGKHNAKGDTTEFPVPEELEENKIDPKLLSAIRNATIGSHSHTFTGTISTGTGIINGSICIGEGDQFFEDILLEIEPYLCVLLDNIFKRITECIDEESVNKQIIERIPHNTILFWLKLFDVDYIRNHIRMKHFTKYRTLQILCGIFGEE